MTNPATTANVWEAITKELFAVLGMVTSQGESRTVGIVYLVKDHKLYIATGGDTWKARHVRNNPRVSITIPIAKRIPIAPWVKLPQATISFSGTARIIPGPEVPPDLLKALLRHKAEDPEYVRDTCAIEVEPEGEFITYGIGIPLIQMPHPELARGRAPVK
jgi:nitroimidazol reductase NimA-like FMN-containing flavoprotein (pyridoxamine 5'-phosphate oxidase superfamily)